MKHLIGIDGGGTHSRLLGTDLNGAEIARLRGRSTNLESNSVETVEANLRSLLDKFWKNNALSKEGCAALCFGTAGVDSHLTHDRVEEMLVRIGLPCPVRVANDSETALFANTAGQPGLLLNAGTGSVGFGVNAQGKTHRVGGFGYLVGDEGSAYWVAREGITAALHAYDRTGYETALLPAISEVLGLTEFSEVIDFVYSRNKTDLARLSRVVSRLASRGDRSACDILRRAAAYLVTAVETLLRELELTGTDTTLYLEGGFLKNSRMLREDLVRALAWRHPRLKICDMQRPAEWGAVHMAAELAGVAQAWSTGP